jgi:hypothetical protein
MLHKTSTNMSQHIWKKENTRPHPTLGSKQNVFNTC